MIGGLPRGYHYVNGVSGHYIPDNFDEGYKPRPVAFENNEGKTCTWKPAPGAGYHHETDMATEWEQDICSGPELGGMFKVTGGILQAIAATGGAATAAVARVYISGFNRSAAQEAAAARARAIARTRQLALIKARMKLRRRPTTTTRRMPLGR